MKGWYMAAVDRVPLPTWVIFEHILEYIVKLYCQVQPVGESTPLYAKPFQV